MAILKLMPAYKDYFWGGIKLKTDFNKEFDGEPLAESWELSCHRDGASIIANGQEAGKTLSCYLEEKGKGILGKNCERFEDFPILIKLIDARENLSIQVHPDNEYALKQEGQFGKTETWYIVDALEGAGIYYGVEKEVTKEEFAKKIEDDTVLDILHFQKVKQGEMYFIEAGTIHAIGKGLVIAEIQQNSNVTYRVYDFGRTGVDGKARELHIEKAKEVAKLTPVSKKYNFGDHFADCDYFTVDEIRIEKNWVGNATQDSFHSILILEGSGIICAKDECVEYRKGDSLFLTAGTGEYHLKGSGKALLTTVRR